MTSEEVDIFLEPPRGSKEGNAGANRVGLQFTAKVLFRREVAILVSNGRDSIEENPDWAFLRGEEAGREGVCEDFTEAEDCLHGGWTSKGEDEIVWVGALPSPGQEGDTIRRYHGLTNGFLEVPSDCSLVSSCGFLEEDRGGTDKQVVGGEGRRGGLVGLGLLRNRFGKIKVDDGGGREISIGQFLTPLGVVSGQKLGARHLEKFVLCEDRGGGRRLWRRDGRASAACSRSRIGRLFTFPLSTVTGSDSPRASGGMGFVRRGWRRERDGDRWESRRGCRRGGNGEERRKRGVVDASDGGRRRAIPSRGLGEGRHSGLRRVTIVHLKVGTEVRVALKRRI
jgi:hypothetical protein